jgi:predicted MPP superfamily phosphohydrolase
MSQRISRRALLRMAVAGTATSVAGYTLLVEPSELRVDHVKIETDLPTGLRIGVLSDFHLADTPSRKRVEEAVRVLTAQAPDIITLLGDYSTAMHTESDIHGFVDTALEILGKLSAPLGVYAILGNHDITRALTNVGEMISKHGITPLINSSVTLRIHGEQFAVVGIDDAIQGHPNQRPAMREIQGVMPVLGLIHEPDASSWMAGFPLILSGHSHGGQVRLPGFGAVVLPQLGRQFPWGLRRNGEALVYTTRGVGMVPPRIRFNCPPEVTIIEIVDSGGRKPMPPVV